MNEMSRYNLKKIYKTYPTILISIKIFKIFIHLLTWNCQTGNL